MTTYRWILIILILFCVLPVFAQDGTAEPTAGATAEPTAVAGVNVNIQKDETPPGNVVVSLLGVIVIIIGGVASGLALPRIIDRIRADPNAIRAIEDRANTLPEETTSAIGKVAGVLESVAKLIEETVDRLPAADKPPEIKLIPDDALIAELEYRGYTVSRPSALNDTRPMS
jgi:hypothetical protein